MSLTDPYAPLPPHVTSIAPPEFTPPAIPQFRGDGWVILDAVPDVPPPSPPPPPPPEVRRVIKADFLRLFTASERVAFNLQRKLVEALQPADYTDPNKAGLVGLEVFLLTYDAIDVIELTHPETIEGMGVLVALGVVTQSRADDVLAGNPAPT
jgi:hypothetical protein